MTVLIVVRYVVSHMASITKKPDSKYYYACFRLPGGEQKTRTTRTTDAKLAQEIANKLEHAGKLAGEKKFFEANARKQFNDILERAGQPKMESATVEHFMREWLKGKENDGTRDRYEKVVDLFLAYLGNRSTEFINNINWKDIQGFQDSRKGYAANTRKLEVKALGIAFNLAKKLELTDHNPVDKALAMNPASIKGAVAQKKPFTLEQVKALLKVATGEWRTVILLGYNTGARLSDCTGMKWSNINFTDRVIDFVTGKKKIPTKVPMIPELEKHLQDIAPDTNAEYISPELAKKKTSGKTGLSEAFRKILLEAGIDPGVKTLKDRKRKHSDLSFHSFRHCCNSILANAGVPQELRMKIIAHKNVNINDGYTHMELETLRGAMDKLPSLT